MNPSSTDDNANRMPRIRRREIGVLLLLLAINWPSVVVPQTTSRHSALAPV